MAKSVEYRLLVMKAVSSIPGRVKTMTYTFDTVASQSGLAIYIRIGQGLVGSVSG